jgi:sec-independent protein translocase protein TatC
LLTYYLEELKTRLIFITYGFVFNCVFCLYFLEELLYISIQPISHYKGFNLIFTEISNAFLSYFNLIIIFSIILTLPFLVLNILLFIIPSLYKYECVSIIYLINSSFFLIISATYFINKVFLPLILNFFFKFEIMDYPFSIFFEGRIDTYLTFIIKIYYLFNIIFQFPLIIIGCFLLKLITIKMLINYRKIFYFSFIIIASILTPPDILSQILLVIPFIIFFELTIFFLILIKNYSKIK